MEPRFRPVSNFETIEGGIRDHAHAAHDHGDRPERGWEERGHRSPAGRAEDGVQPSPATHSILTLLEAGESRFQTLSMTKTVFHALRGAQPLFHVLFLSSKQCLGNFWAPPSQSETGYGTRFNLPTTIYPINQKVRKNAEKCCFLRAHTRPDSTEKLKFIGFPRTYPWHSESCSSLLV